MLARDVCDGILGSMDPQTDYQDYYASMAAPVEEIMQERRRYRTGTWAFMSIGLLRNPKKAHDILDDFESIFWTMLYCGIHCFQHTKKIDVGIFTEARYDPNAEVNDMVQIVGGDGKLFALYYIPIKFRCKPFNRLAVHYLPDAIRCYYDSKFYVKRLEEARADDSDPDSDEESSRLSKAQKTFKEYHDRINDPDFWIQMFEEALSKNGWQDDLVEEDQYAT